MRVFGLTLLIAGSLASPSRDEKFLSVFNIVKFNNDVCTAASGGGKMGTCYTASECTTLGGTADGTCASTFGVCCTANVDTCTSSAGSLVRLNNTYISSPNFPSTVSVGAATCTTARQAAAAATTYTYTIAKPTNVEQIRLDFLNFEIDNPTLGMCSNGTGMTITGADAITNNVLPSNLCGVLTGQHVYLSVLDATNITITIKIGTAAAQKWQILVRFFETSQTEYLAPRGCLQYFRESSGTINSFNVNSGTGMLLTDHMYSICIASVPNYCNVAMTATTFALSGTSGTCAATDDKIVLGVSTFCGSTFGTAMATTWTYLGGEYIIPVMTGSTNAASNAGFEISFLLLPC